MGLGVSYLAVERVVDQFVATSSLKFDLGVNLVCRFKVRIIQER